MEHIFAGRTEPYITTELTVLVNSTVLQRKFICPLLQKLTAVIPYLVLQHCTLYTIHSTAVLAQHWSLVSTAVNLPSTDHNI